MSPEKNGAGISFRAYGVCRWEKKLPIPSAAADETAGGCSIEQPW
jgi:hypothetical protein